MKSTEPRIVARQVVRLRHVPTGRYLYSLSARYNHAGSSNQQLVGATAKPDDDCNWCFIQGPQATDPVRPGVMLTTDSPLALHHLKTGKNLHSHDARSPTSRQQEVTAYGSRGYGDVNDGWQINFLNDVEEGSVITLIHRTHRALHSHSNGLNVPGAKPESYEVTGIEDLNSSNIHWQVEPIPDVPLEPPQTPLASIQPNADLPAIAFYHPDAPLNWVEKERQKWNWLLEQRLTFGRHFEQAFDELRTSATEIRNLIDRPEFESAVASFSRNVNDIYRSGRILYSESKFGGFVLNMAQDQPKESAYAAAALCNLEFSPTSAATFRGALLAELFRSDLAGAPAIEREALAAVTSQWRKEAEQLRSEMAAQLKEAQTQINAANKMRETFATASQKLLDEKMQAFENLEHARKKEIDLRVSRQYWQSKATRHAWVALLTGLVCVALIAAAAWQIQNQFHQLFPFPDSSTPTATVAPAKPATANPPTTTAAKTEEKPPIEYWRYLLIGVFVTFSVWFIRIFVRIALGNLHQHEDAKERVTMIQTYLALVSEGKVPRDDDARLILASLFRPGATGLVEADAGAATPLEIVLKNVPGLNEKS